MVIELFQEEEIELTFSYEPVWELFFSMHVLARPAHHLDRKKWVERVELRHKELAERVRMLDSLTDCWNMVIDSDNWMEMRQMEIPEAYRYLAKMTLSGWNKMTGYYDKEFTRREKSETLNVIKCYYEEFYKKEEAFLRPFLVRSIKDEIKKCRNKGFFRWCEDIHPRLMIKEEGLLYLKNREFFIPKRNIQKAYITVSTFLSPHLWMYTRSEAIEVIKPVIVEQREGEIAEDYLLIFKALGDVTRMKIVRELAKEPGNTKGLSCKFGISEAAVSKQLKILWEAKIVSKCRKGSFVEYELNSTTIDYIPYYFYELMLT